MSRLVRVNAGFTGIQLPDGGPLRDGVTTVTLTDDQFAKVSDRAFTSGALTDMGATGGSSPVGHDHNATYVRFLQAAMNPDLLIVGAITRDANGAATSAPVVWPDGTAGTYTGTASTAFPGAVDSYTITYGSPVTKTYTQPAVTRNADGATVTRPAMTVA